VPEWRLSFQSRAGKAEWLTPDTEHALARLAADGKREVLVVPISFVSDHIETLYEIDLLFGEVAEKHGLTMKRSPSLNTLPRFIEALAGLVERKLAPPAQ
jgi:ferrochelatase